LAYIGELWICISRLEERVLKLAADRLGTKSRQPVLDEPSARQKPKVHISTYSWLQKLADVY
jgi:hypothetical protein